MSVMVYNRDFVERTLRESSRIPGVFVLSGNSAEAQKRIEAIENPGGERDSALNNLQKAQSSYAQAVSADNDAAEQFRNSSWAAYKSFIEQNPSLKPAFTGAGGIGKSKQTLVDKLLVREPAGGPITALGDLTKSAQAVFDDTAISREEFTLPAPFNGESRGGYALLGKPIVGSDSVTLSELVERLGNSDWVSAGRAHLAHSGGVCPFCQQSAPAALAAELAKMFNDSYTADRDSVQQFSDAFAEWSSGLNSSLSDLPDGFEQFLDVARYEAARRELTEATAMAEQQILDKLRTPSTVVEFTSPDEALAGLNKVLSDANAQVRDHNKLLVNRKTARVELVKECWRYFSEAVLKDEAPTYVAKSTGRAHGIDKLANDIDDAKQKIADLDAEVRELQKSVESTLPVIESINTLLERSGFTSFKIVESPRLKDGYMLSRDDGEVQERSLSEGERTFVAFLYYLHLLDGTPAEGAASRRILAVIDDPISSLDSDVLFLVSAMVRHLAERVLSEVDHVKQLIVLTHNVYFYKEVSWAPGADEKGRTHFLIRKHPGAPSTITSSRKSPVTTEYKRLWDEVKLAREGQQMNIVGLENIQGRILESYFRLMGGGIWDKEIEPLLEESERHVFRALFRWANGGSHAIFEDIYYSPSPIEQELYLRVFERIFEVTKQTAHFNMMLKGRASLPEAAELGE